MSLLLIFSTVTITLALVFYSWGIWAERIAKYLKPWHVKMFWTGFTFDVIGTTAMHFIATQPFNLLDWHTLTGQLALWLMLAHAIWAQKTIKSGTNEQRIKFHTYSIAVWLVWLIPYIGGMVLGMS